jgi:hypothetical protein
MIDPAVDSDMNIKAGYKIEIEMGRGCKRKGRYTDVQNILRARFLA